MSAAEVLRTALLVLVCVAVANVIYQWAGPRDWSAAVERTWFQAVALVALVLVVWLKLRGSAS